MQPTHAGGVVFRVTPAGVPEFLVVTAKRAPSEWVYPKGRIEWGETPDEAAAREVLEEAGVRAVVIAALPDVQRTVRGVPQHLRYFAMRALDDTGAKEGRESCWLPVMLLRKRLKFRDARELLDQANAIAERDIVSDRRGRGPTT